jgi:uncharacterized protein with beta-barrel porin domain
MSNKKEFQRQNNYHNDTYNNGDTINQSGNGAINGKVITINNTYYTAPAEKSTCENEGTSTKIKVKTVITITNKEEDE